MKKLTSILNRILSVVLIAVLLFSGYVFAKVLRAGKDKVPSVFGFSFMQVATGSMEPTIPTGVLIVVRKVEPAQIRVGDVISFYSTDPLIDGKPNTHRVAEISHRNGTISFITKGDASTQTDPYPVYSDQLIGVYLRYFSIGKAVEVLHSQAFFLFVLVIPLCVVIFFEFLRVKNMFVKKEDNNEEDP